MPHLITNMSERQVNPIFPSKKNQTTPCQQKRGRTAQKKQPPFRKPTTLSKAPPERTCAQRAKSVKWTFL